MQTNERVLGRLLEYERRGLTPKEIAYLTGFSLKSVQSQLHRYHSRSAPLKPMELLAVLAFHAYQFDAYEVAEWLGVSHRSAFRYIALGTDKLRHRRLEAGL